MTTQLFIPVEVCNQFLLEKAEKQYDIDVKRKDMHPVHLVANTSRKDHITYHVWWLTSKELIESFKSFKIIK